MKDKLLYAAVFLALLVFGFFAGTKVAQMEVPEIRYLRDTIVIRDTIRVDHPVTVTQRVVDRVLVPVTDTITLHDTTFVVLPRIQKEYADSLYRAWVSGYDPSLDSIAIFRRERIVETVRTVTPRPKRWHVGVSAGYGASLLNEGVQLSPYVGVGVTYSLFAF